MKMRPVSAAILLLLSSLTLAAHADDMRRPYIVQLVDKPIASYNGEVNGLNATQPAPGQRLDLASNDVQLYNDYLGQKQATVQAAIADAPVSYTYSVVLNGFAAMLTDAEVRALQARSDVADVSADTPRSMVTSYTPDFLGLDKPDGLWSKLGGKTSAGENVIIGIVDGGVSPDNPAFADRVDANGKPTFDNSGTIVYSAPPASWRGICQTGEGFTVANCNNKLIGAQYFDASYLAQNKTTDWTEFKSPRDSLANAGWGGHGTHTAGTAGGNANVDVTVAGVGLGSVSGMAPRARLATYKVCWSYLDAAQANGVRNACFTGDSVAAIEKSVADGVNIINYSISGGGSITDPVEQAFRNASNAGVFVAASAGNAGPANTVAHISPWLTTVAASTHNRTYVGDATLGSGEVLSGASNNAKTASAPLVLAKDAAVDGMDPANAANLALCFGAADGSAPLLDPAKVSGKILVCDRGGNILVNKSANGRTAGAVGMIIANTPTSANTIIVQGHTIPTVHIVAADGARLKTYIAANPGSATAALGNVRPVADASVPAPVMASFSSRGPNMFDPNLLKPDLTAPGVDILAAHSPNQTQAERADIINGTHVPPAAWAPLQGTSMSSPHVAGLAALLRQLHPSWSPAAIKSALMTTGYNTLPDAIASGDTRGILPFAQGAGHVNPNSAADPGLVYDATEADYKKYMCGAGVSTQCAGGTMVGYNLNMPSISVSNVLGSVVVNRSVTNVGTSAATYNASISVPGYTAVVSPASLSLNVGETKPFTVTLTRSNAPSNTWQFGTMSWTDGSHVVRSPVVARSGAPVVAPGTIVSNRASLSKSISVTTGFTGKMNTVYGGLKEISRTAYNVTQAPGGSVETVAQIQTACRAAGPGVRVVPVTVPSGAVLAQFELFDRDTGNGKGSDDLDMALLNGAGNVVATALHGGSNESIVMPSPAAGNYRVCVIGYTAANGQSTDFSLSSAVVTSSDRGGNFRVLVPTKVYASSTASVSASWSGLPAGKRYAGAMQLLDAAGGLASTTVFRVETNNPVPLAEAVERAKPKDTAL
ncbi:S8 family serine peptidase [Massilia sp. CMS3.1]|uniref:S8 family serine peptidase n=1 Tax=Massilia sp. CMS3.1 TaxID=3373083 RepID=UPI003EE81B4F